MKKLFISILLIIGSAKASLLDTFYSKSLNVLPHAMIFTEPCLTLNLYLNTDNILKNFKKIEHEKMLAFFKETCAEITDEKINFYVGSSYHFGLSNQELAFVVRNNNIVISQEYYVLLEELFNKENLTEVDQKTLNILRFILQHESSHLKNTDLKKRLIASIFIAISQSVLYESLKNQSEFKYHKLISFFVLSLIGQLTFGKLCKAQEYNADDAVYNKEVIKGGMQFFTNMINLYKNKPELDWQNTFDGTHPSPESRFTRLNARL
ncbi:MAG: M48 family metalloprotease [Candidatus Babeliales bacterium]